MSYDIERINFTVTIGNTVKVSHKTRHGNNRIVGICFISHSGDASAVGAGMKLSIDKNEFFSSDFDPSLIAFTQRTPVQDRYWDYINTDINQSDIDIEFTANATAGGTFSILLKCERND